MIWCLISKQTNKQASVLYVQRASCQCPQASTWRVLEPIVCDQKATTSDRKTDAKVPNFRHSAINATPPLLRQSPYAALTHWRRWAAAAPLNSTVTVAADRIASRASVLLGRDMVRPLHAVLAAPAQTPAHDPCSVPCPRHWRPVRALSTESHSISGFPVSVL